MTCLKVKFAVVLDSVHGLLSLGRRFSLNGGRHFHFFALIAVLEVYIEDHVSTYKDERHPRSQQWQDIDEAAYCLTMMSDGCRKGEGEDARKSRARMG